MTAWTTLQSRPPAQGTQRCGIVHEKVGGGNQEYGVFTVAEDPRGEFVKRSGEPFGIDVDDFGPGQRGACVGQAFAVSNMGYQRDGNTARQTGVPLPTDLRNGPHAGSTLICGQEDVHEAPLLRFRGRAGTPATSAPGATSRVTTAFAPTTALSPMLTPPSTVTPRPIQTLRPISIGVAA